MVIIDPKKEKNAVSEARKLGVTTVALIDTDCDPDLVDLPIPGNDDSIRSIELVLQQLADAVLEGKAKAATAAQTKGERRRLFAPAAKTKTRTKGRPAASRRSRGRAVAAERSARAASVRASG